ALYGDEVVQLVDRCRCGLVREPSRYAHRGIAPLCGSPQPFFEHCSNKHRVGVRASLEVDAHHNPAEGWSAYLGEPCGGKDAAAPDMELDRHDFPPRLRDHRVA